VQEHYGDYGDFTQNKSKEWADLCGADRHVCSLADGTGSMGASPGLRRLGVTSRLNRFIDHYARPPGNPDEPRPPFDSTVSLQVCPANADSAFPADEPGERFTETTFAALAPERLRLSAGGTQTTTSDAEPNQHAARADPIANLATNASRCPVETTPAGPGVAVYDFAPLTADVVMIGQARVTVPYSGSGSDLQLAGRLYELRPDGSQVLVDRGVVRLAGGDGIATMDLQGNGWRFTRGNRLRLELAQDDDPYLKASTTPSSLTLSGAAIDLPVRRAGPDAVLRAPRLASDAGTRVRFPFSVTGRSGELTGAHSEVLVSSTRGRRSQPIRAGSFRGRPGRTYRIRARLLDRGNVPGDFVMALTVVPLDDGSRRLRYDGRWRRARERKAWGGALRRGSRNATVRFRARGDRLYLVARTTRSGGAARVTIGRRSRVVRFRSSRVLYRRVVLTARLPRGTAGVRLRVLRGPVELDAVGVRAP
jgi:hypothetical protein